MNFRNVFFATILEAGTTCGDRVALSILQLELKYEIHKCKDPTRLADLLLKGLWTLNFLESAAENKLRTLRISDPIETYLAYPVKLAKDIGYPLPVPEMLYFGCSGVTEGDLEEAKTMVLQRLAPKNYKDQAEFLRNQDDWRKLFKGEEILEEQDGVTEGTNPKKRGLTEEEMEKRSKAQENLLKATEDFLNESFHRKPNSSQRKRSGKKSSGKS